MINDRHEGLPLGQTDDRELALAFQRGEDGAYQAIHDRYETRVRSICRRMLGGEDDAQEASQEAFLRVYQGLIRFNGRYQLQAWVTRIATNVCLDHLRARQRRPADATPLEELDLNPSGYAEDTDPERLFIRKAEGRRVRRVLNALPPMHRAALVLRDFEGLSYGEVALALGITEGQVKALLHRARNGFKKSWLELLSSFLLPLRAGHRFKPLDPPAKHSGSHGAAPNAQVAEAVASTAQVATSCSSILQQCGQFVGERVAPIVTAAIVGTATVGIAAATHPKPSAQLPVSDASTVTVGSLDDGADSQTRRYRSTRASQRGTDDHPPAPGGSGDASGSTAPAPSASPSPSPASPPSDGGTTGGTKTPPSPTPTPSPTPFTAAVGFHHAGEPIPATPPSSRTEKINCDAYYLEQRLVTTVSYEGGRYPATFTLYARVGAGRVDLRVTKNGANFYYSSWGPEPVATWARSGRELTLEITGQYGPLYGSNPEEAGLPRSGSFYGQLAVDCTVPSVVTEDVGFTYE
ncbi:MAG: RNA polymerase sigma factor [Actinomycetota bacterium]